MTATGGGRADAQLRTLDVEDAIAAGLAVDSAADSATSGAARRVMFGDVAVAASLHAEALGVGPHPLNHLARYVRAAGRAAALALPEPLIGERPTALARSWLTAAGTDGGTAADDLFAQWLDSVAALIALRRRSGRPL